MGMNFVVNHCHQAEFIYHIDDDTYFSSKKFYKLLWNNPRENLNNTIFCNSNTHIKPRVIRSYHATSLGKIPDFKLNWGISVKNYRHSYYPTFCSGSGYSMDMESYRIIYKLSKKINFEGEKGPNDQFSLEKLDDVVLTGILRSQAGIRIRQLGDNYICYHLDNHKKFIEKRIMDWWKLGKYPKPEWQW